MDAKSSAAPPLVSIIIVNYNSGTLVRDCVSHVLRSQCELEVWVVDNGSIDDSLAKLRSAHGSNPRLQIRELGKNLGFATASNHVLAQANGQFLLFLNPDCFVQEDTLSHCAEVLQTHPQAGMAGVLVVNPDGSEQAGCRRSVPTPWRSLVRVLHLDKLFPKQPRFRHFVLSHDPLPEDVQSIEGISGAFMFVRREALEDVGPLDEGYFLHCEDLDWFMRFRQHNWQILFIPSLQVMHVKGACSQGEPVRVLWYKHRGMVRFYRKFFSQRYGCMLMWAVIASVWLRFTLLSIYQLIRSK